MAALARYFMSLGLPVAGYDRTPSHLTDELAAEGAKISFDDAMAAVAEGRMAATVAQKPDLMGATAVETALKLIAGESVEKEIPVEVELVTE